MKNSTFNKKQYFRRKFILEETLEKNSIIFKFVMKTLHINDDKNFPKFLENHDNFAKLLLKNAIKTNSRGMYSGFQKIPDGIF